MEFLSGVLAWMNVLSGCWQAPNLKNGFMLVARSLSQIYILCRVLCIFQICDPKVFIPFINFGGVLRTFKLKNWQCFRNGISMNVDPVYRLQLFDLLLSWLSNNFPRKNFSGRVHRG